MKLPSDWKRTLKQCNMALARRELAEFFRLTNLAAESQDQQAVFKTEFVHGGMISQTIAKGTDIATISRDKIAWIEQWGNNYPREIIGFQTAEKFINMEIAA